MLYIGMSDEINAAGSRAANCYVLPRVHSTPNAGQKFIVAY